jgi:MoxR-like ATPase
MATQNPVEQEGTYPLPEAQRDRFLFKLVLDYPQEEEEFELMLRWGKITSHPELVPVSDGHELLALRAEVDAVHVDEGIQRYMLALVRGTRALTRAVPAAGANGLAEGGKRRVKPLLSYGASPRASLSLFQAGKALAWLRGSDFVTPSVVQDIFLDVMRHRVGLSYDAEAERVTADDVLRGVIERVPVPKIGGK